MQITIRRNNEEFGPYSHETLLEYVNQGVFQTDDEARLVGMSEWKRLGKLLGLESPTGPLIDTPEIDPAEEQADPANLILTPVRRRGARLRRRTMRFGGVKMGILVAVIVALVILLGVRYSSHYSGRASLAESGQPGPDASPLGGLDATLASDKPAPVAPAPAPDPAPAVVAATPVSPAPPAPAPSPASAVAAATPALAASPVPALAAASPSAAPAFGGSPAGLVAAATPAASAAPPAPAVSTPSPAPTPFDPVSLAANPAVWPKTLRLTQAATFPAVVNSQVVGNLTVPAGTVVQLVNIQEQQLTLDYRGGEANFPWTITDIAQQMAAAPAPAAAQETASFPPR